MSETRPPADGYMRYRRPLKDRLGRGDRSALGVWFWELDRLLLALIVTLVAIGLLAVAAGSPASARRLSDATGQLSPLYFFYRQLFWVALSLPLMLFISMFPRAQLRRGAIIGFCVVLALMFLVPLIGKEVNGARRWIGYGFAAIQPSEFLKPLFALTLAWLLSLRAREPDLPLALVGGLILAIVGSLLMLQPDLGQTIMFVGIWFAVMWVAGLDLRRAASLVTLGIAGLVTAYFTYGVARQRIDGWLFGGTENDQTDLALRTLTAGGVIGTGPGLGTRKFSLPEAHTDYIFSVIGEEFGLIACAIIALIYFALIVRICLRLLDEEDNFTILAVTGLAAQLGGQAFINIAVNLHLFPSKGMTLPFISYGGSSMLALAITSGLLLGLTRRNPYAAGLGARPVAGKSRSAGVDRKAADVTGRRA